MSHTTPDPSGGELSGRVVAILRTAVPAWWGSLAAWLLAQLATHLPADVTTALADLLNSETAKALAVALAIAAWYSLWRALERHVPAWLVRIVLGSARTPTYAPTSADGAAIITTLSTDERSNLASLRDALDEGDPGRTALERVLTT